VATFVSISDALSQYQSACPWQNSPAAASLALDAVRYLMLNRPSRAEDVGSSLNYESLAEEKKALESFIGVISPRAFGRSRFVGIAPAPVQGPT
jgi:hypothetical protein